MKLTWKLIAVALCTIGGAMVAVGLGWIYPPLGVVCAGAMALCAGLFIIDVDRKP